MSEEEKKQLKEVAKQVAVEAITEAAKKDLSGEEKEQRVFEFLAKLDDNIAGVNFIPNALEAQIIELGIDKVVEFYHSIDLKAFVKSTYQRIKYLLKRLFHN